MPLFLALCSLIAAPSFLRLRIWIIHRLFRVAVSITLLSSYVGKEIADNRDNYENEQKEEKQIEECGWLSGLGSE